MGYLPVRVWSSNAVAGAALHSTSPFLVCFPWKQSAILQKPSEMGQTFYEKQVSLSSLGIPVMDTAHHYSGPPTHSQLPYGLLVAQSFIPQWKFSPKVHALPGMALASDWLREETKGPSFLLP